MIRVLHLVKTSTGARWALRQMQQLVKLNVETHVALPPGGPRIPEYQAAGIVVHPIQCDLPVKQPWRWPQVSARLRALVSDVQPDLIHSYFVGTTLTMRLALGKKHPLPRLFQVPGPLHLENPFFRKLDFSTAGQIDYWAGTCKWTCDCYRRSGIPPERVFLAYFGEDLERYKNAEQGTLRAEIGVDHSTKIVGMVALMYKPKLILGQTRGLKGHEDFIEAMAICLKSRPDLLGVCVGGAWGGAEGYERRLRRYGKKRCGARLVFLGTRPYESIPTLYRDFDVAVVPSHSENLGGAFEPMLMSVPTVATKVGGLPDLVRNDETGWLVPPKCPRELAKAIRKVLDNEQEAQQVARQGQIHAYQVGNVVHNAAKVRDIYQQILSIHNTRSN